MIRKDLHLQPAEQACFVLSPSIVKTLLQLTTCVNLRKRAGTGGVFLRLAGVLGEITQGESECSPMYHLDPAIVDV